MPSLGTLRYAGRFAPSPTGPLHAGSLFTALASYLDARANAGLWYLRIDDIDAPRAQAGAAEQIQRCLEAHGLTWDGSTQFQSRHLARYQDALAQLHKQKDVFFCRCSRNSLPRNTPYPGTCRAYQGARSDAAQRVRCNDQIVAFVDRLQGPIRCDLGQTCGDFVVWRRDGLPAYQLATAVDDGAAAITVVMRGSDLLDITGRQIYLMQRLGLTPPGYAHLPVLTDAQGVKLSKRTGAAATSTLQPGTNLANALRQLGLQTPADLAQQSVEQILDWAVQAWSPVKLSGIRDIAGNHSSTALGGS